MILNVFAAVDCYFWFLSLVFPRPRGCEAVPSSEWFLEKQDAVLSQYHNLGGYYGIIDTSGDVWREHRRFALQVFRNLGLGKNLMQEKVGITIDEIKWYISFRFSMKSMLWSRIWIDLPNLAKNFPCKKSGTRGLVAWLIKWCLGIDLMRWIWHV